MASLSRTPLRIDHPADGVIALWLDRPTKRNALNTELTLALLEAFEAPHTRAIVLGTTDPRCFCSGADRGLSDTERADVSDLLYTLYRRMALHHAPIVAAVEGPAVGGGAQLAVACDLRIGSPTASLRFVGPGHGLAVGSWALPALVGRGRAADLCLTMRPIAADEAHRVGLLDRLDQEPRSAAIELAIQIAGLAPEAAARVKSVVHAASNTVVALDEERERNRASWSGALA